VGKKGNIKLVRFQKSNAGPSWIGLFQNNWTKHTHSALSDRANNHYSHHATFLTHNSLAQSTIKTKHTFFAAL